MYFKKEVIKIKLFAEGGTKGIREWKSFTLVHLKIRNDLKKFRTKWENKRILQIWRTLG